MVAWVIGLGVSIFGDTEFGVRAGMLGLALGSTVLVFALGRRWFGRQVGWWAVLLFTLMPIFIGTGALAFPDGPLIFFWLLTLYAVTRGLNGVGEARYLLSGNRWRFSPTTVAWLGAGVAFGAALLSKYTAVLLAPSLALFLALSRRQRHWLRRPEPWVAVVIALLVFSPVIWWNAQHDWASFRFQTSRTDDAGESVALNVGKFWMLQVGVLTPVFFGLCVVAAWRAIIRGWWQRDDRWNFVAAFFFPLFVVFVRASFKTEVHANWTAPAYLTLILAAAAVIAEGMGSAQPQIVRRWRLGGAVTAGFCCVLFLVGLTTYAWGKPASLAYRQAGGWRELGKQVHEIEDAFECVTGERVVTIGVDKYNLAAQLGFYMQEQEDTVNAFMFGKKGLAYPYWTDWQKFQRLPAVLVFKRLDAETDEILSNNFERVSEPQRLEVAAGPNRRRVVYVVTAHPKGSTTPEHVESDGRPIDHDDGPQPAR
ncbi:MAG: hypothetical protein PCFJNLEI_02831 [Verrucomicrobiae bacterium]|nr:hypothetical protein [Verrucomicrobiae bacterium]